jgi:preprotein translocase subunit SecD
VRKTGLTSLIVFLLITLGAVVGVLVAGWRPLLGLDLQGGVSVVLRPVEQVDEASLNQAIEIIRNRVDAFGVAEPDISRQGDNIVVELPGVKDQQRALDLVGTTAELRFRPVLAFLGPPPDPNAPTTTAPVADASSPSVVVETTTTAAGATTTTTPATTAATPTTEGGLGGTGTGTGEVALGPRRAQDTTAPTTTAPTTTAPTTTAPTTTAPTTTAAATATTADIPVTPNLDEITPREQDTPEATVVLPILDDEGNISDRLLLGPALATGEAVKSATRALNPNDGSPFVALTFKDGAAGVDAWRNAAGTCFRQDQTLCPTRSLAIVLDGEVVSAPQVNDDFADSKEATITGDFDQSEAKDLADKLKYGALPVELERQQAQEVSATVGEDALRAGVVAGLVGLALASLYLIAFYRILGLVAVGSLLVSFALLWAIIAYAGEKQGLALSLAGVVGIIVSIGVSLDSNIVYFEVIKEDMQTGRNLRSSVERSFRSAWRTILRADIVSLIAAALLWLLTVGAVQGFAFYLGLATILDLVASWFFMRPVVNLLARSGLASKLSAFGIRTAPATPGAAA